MHSSYTFRFNLMICFSPNTNTCEQIQWKLVKQGLIFPSLSLSSAHSITVHTKASVSWGSFHRKSFRYFGCNIHANTNQNQMTIKKMYSHTCAHKVERRNKKKIQRQFMCRYVSRTQPNKVKRSQENEWKKKSRGVDDVVRICNFFLYFRFPLFWAHFHYPPLHSATQSSIVHFILFIKQNCNVLKKNSQKQR